MGLYRARFLLLLLLVTTIQAENADDVDLSAEDSAFIKTLRDLKNQTEADTLNLPANASSIRENITDTFSCENRTYGYYADVDNDCQVFHVCLPSQTPSGRNVTYRWSFICPNETIFNQAVLTCMRPKDSIECELSPMFYHLNDEIGKVPNKTEEAKDKRKIHKRKPEKLVMDTGKDFVIEDLKEGNRKPAVESPILLASVIENLETSEESVEDPTKEEEGISRIVMERSRRNERKMKRGMFRFKSDV